MGRIIDPVWAPTPALLPNIVNYSGDTLFNNVTGGAANFDFELGSTLSRFRVLTTAGANLFTVNNSGEWIWSQTNQKVLADTIDGTDNKGVFYCGGGNNAVGRGAYLFVGGNEYSGAQGIAALFSGDASSAYVEIRASSAVSPTIRFSLTATEQWRMSSNELTGMNTTSNQIARTNNTGFLIVSGGSGAGAQATGAYLTLRGATASSPGITILSSADNVGAYCLYEAAAAAGDHRFRIAGVEQWRISGNSLLGMPAATTMSILRNDTASLLQIGAGTSAVNTSGAFIQLYGNTHASAAGRMLLYSGTASGLMIFEMGLSTGAFRFRNASAVNLLDISSAQFYTNVDTGGDYSMRINGSQVMNLSAAGLQLPSLADAAAGNNRWYYSTTQSKAVYKDGAGVVNVLY
jgi:hypothetical protein